MAKVVSRVVYNHLPQIKQSAKAGARRIVWQTALEILRGSQRRMEGPKHGRLYRRGAVTRAYKVGGKRAQAYQAAGARSRVVGGKLRVTTGYQFHRASAPGEAPAIDLGKLRASGEADMVGESAAMVSYSAVYAARQEMGGSDSRGVNIEARPYLKPEAEDAQPRFETRMKDMLAGLK